MGTRGMGARLGAGVSHVDWIDPGVELLSGDGTRVEGGLFETQTLGVGSLGNGSGLIVADVTIQSRHLHQVLVQIGLDSRQVWLDAAGTVLVKHPGGVSQKLDGLQTAPGHDGLEDVELEVALAASEADSGIIAEDFGRHHRHGFGLGWVDFTRHDRTTRFVFWQDQLADAVARPGGIPANVVGNLHASHRQET